MLTLSWLNNKLKFLTIVTLMGVCSEIRVSAFVQPFSCGTISNVTSFLTGRGIRSPVDVPWHVSITRRNELYPDVTIPGLLISPSLVLTRAYHFNERDTDKFIIFPFDNYRAAVGTRNFGDPAHFEENEHTQVKKITHIRIHPHYKIGRWTLSLNDFALIHLAEEVTITAYVEPVCLPRSPDTSTIMDLRTPSSSSNSSELSLTGWNRQNPQNIFLRLKIQRQSQCKTLWDKESETNPVPFNSSRIWCAFVGEENNHTICIHNNVGAVAAVKLVNGSFYMAGIVRELYSSNRSRICRPSPIPALYYFDVIPSDTFSWIEDNMKCGPQNFTCSNGQCVNLSKLCDRTKDCSDTSDEDPGFCRGRNFCQGDQLPCGVYGACYLKGGKCNGKIDCEEGEDEQDCQMQDQTSRNIAMGISIVLIVLIVSGTVLWRLQLKRLKNEIRNLTKKEVKDFLHGMDPPDIKQRIKDGSVHSSKDYNYLNDLIQSRPWKKEYEIPMKSLIIGPEINRGRFGIVNKGTLVGRNRGDFKNYDVAIKTHIKSVRVTEFKALLCELKIQAYLEQNDYIPKFWGACTQDIKKREVYMVIEYCPNGNLHDFLKENGKYYIKQGTADHTDFADYVLDYSQFGFIDDFDLLLWSTQISCGMEFLASQNVIHADLAARNVLLTDAFNVKISDFGLSKKFGGSGIYIKSTSEPIAWKWLAVETFKSMAYSEKSDVWAFGVTLYEIYSLCQVEPYFGVEWTEQFVNDLEVGERLSKPAHASDEIYKLMSFCWKLRPEDRPRFKALKSNLTILLQEYRSEKYQRRLSEDLKANIGEYLQVV